MIEHILSLTPWMGVVLIIIGCIALIKGADWLVEGASSIAKRFGISDLVIGLTVVALGTSMPEFVVNMVSVANGATELAITNVLGSNIINIFIILGLSAIVYPIASQKRSRQFDIPFSILAAILVLAAVLINGDGIHRKDGIIMLCFFLYFLYNALKSTKNPNIAQEETIVAQPQPVWKALLAIIGGLLGLIIGGELIVKSAVDIATRLGVSEAIIGLTVVALGTSLPELATSVIAAMKKNADIALGNVI
ncbi:MAG: calcium/sodium antiporter, partial [Paludibacteraceae bacterium]|nr:calcium/sodium antiporter [Paludibacteraceae bacterium]